MRTRRYPPADSALLLFSLGRLYDSCGAFDEAYLTFEAANRHALDAAGAAVRPYDSAAEAAWADALAQAYASTGMPKDGVAAPDSTPVSILGMFRSGSTLPEKVLGSHSEIAAGGEFDLLPRSARGLGAGPWEQVRAPTATILEHADAYLRRLRTLQPTARFVTDKRPDNFWHVGLIKRLFPRARIINTRRRALDELVSVWSIQLDATMNYSFRVEDIAVHTLTKRRMTAHWNQLYPQDILTVDYERLVRNPEAEVTRVPSFLGLPYEDACLEFHRTPGVVRTAIVWQVRERAAARSLGRTLAPLRGGPAGSSAGSAGRRTAGNRSPRRRRAEPRAECGPELYHIGLQQRACRFVQVSLV